LAPEDGVRFLQALEIAKARLPEPVPEADEAADDAVEGCQDCREASPELAARCPQLPAELRRCRESVTAVTSPIRRSAAKSSADALIAMADQTVTTAEQASDPDSDAGSGGLPGLGDDRFQIVIHVSAETSFQADNADDDGLDGISVENGPRLHPTIGRRISCDCPYAIQTDDAAGNPLHLGRRTRRIRGRLARAVHHRDHGHCQAPGCTTPTTEIHHRRHWADGGPTCLTNLISLCDAHHWLVHDGGWTITGHSPATWRFRDPDGRTIAGMPAPLPAPGPLPQDPTIRPDAITGHWDGTPLNLGDTVHRLCNLPSYS
jgi:hypothetical protein